MNVDRRAPVSPAVRPIDGGDVQAVAAMLARAFDDDPLSVWIFPSARSRRRALRTFFSVELRSLFLPGGLSYATADISSAALWTPPGNRPPGAVFGLSLMPLLIRVGPRVPRVIRLLAAVQARHPRPAHYYLGVLGTEPALQGRGLGSAVLGPVLERCDAEGMPAYLESSKERNVPFYRRHGFEVVEELRLDGAPTLWLMWRDPRGA